MGITFYMAKKIKNKRSRAASLRVKRIAVKNI